jgi:hypothetical protein
MPIHWRTRRDPLYSEEAVAWHEAGHVVVAYEFGWWLRRGGVRVGAWAHACHRHHPDANTVLARCCVYLAGLVAEQRFHNQQGWQFAGRTPSGRSQPSFPLASKLGQRTQPKLCGAPNTIFAATPWRAYAEPAGRRY